ncbi:TonB-dependent receptor [Novosphingobium sp. HBC54]|uniref:TonB-dependent receptor n=2 Tax=Novosphingobium cyanobacteriorum TaxID=3024215 RepID=A0ABT6CGV6_9SPHN|nr:TonB-dependent receptor [Novosphingobium cyanobacteriorum]
MTAFAQEAAQQSSDNSASPPEIVVTAQFREQKLQDTPIAITAVTGEMIEQRSASALADIANTAPSVVLRPASAAFGNSITASIRGFGQIDFNPAYEPGVGLYIDDVYYPRLTGANFDLMDVERVEVLRGPQGTLTGRNSEGGAIKFVSRKPTGNGGGYVSATYGIRNRINLRASADFTIAKDLFARVSGAFADQEGYVNVIDYGCAKPASGLPSTTGGTKCTKYKLGDVGYKAVRGILRYNPSDRVDVMISADYTKDNHNNGAEVLLYANNPNPNVQTVNGLPYDSRFICGRWCNYTSTGQEAGAFVAGLIPPLNGFPLAATTGQQSSDYEGWGVSGNIDLGLSDSFKLTSITAYRGWNSSFSIDNDLSPARVGFGNNQLTHWFWSQELRLNAKLGEMADATVGGYYSDEKTTYYTLQDIRYVAANIPGVGLLPIFPLQFIGNDPVRTKSKAVFGTVIVRPMEAMTITAGVRYTKDEKAYTFYRYNLDGTTINPFLDPIGAANGAGYDGPNGTALTGRTAKFSGDRVDYRISLDYRFSPEVLAFATVATGYKAGGVGPRPFNAAQARGFGPETLTSYEIGIKTDLLDRKVRLNLAGFYNDFKDAQLTLLSCPQFGGPGPCALPQNAGNAKVKGFEAELSARPVNGLQIDGSFSYVDWKWKCVNPAVVGQASGPCNSDPAIVGLLSKNPRGLIKTKWSFGIQYDAELGNAGSLTPRFDIAYQSGLAGGDVAPVPGSPSATFGQVPGFTLSNARLTWQNEAKDVSVALEVTNLFDKYYFVSKFDLTGAGAGAITGQVGRPREWAVTLKKKF